MKTIEELLSGMEVREAYEAGRMAERLEMAREADARCEKAHAELAYGVLRLERMVEELPAKLIEAAVAAAEAGTEEVKRRLEAREWVDEVEVVEDEQVESVEDRGRWSVDDEVWRLDGEVEQRVAIALPLDVAIALMRVRAVED